jgi:TatD DNase family protein
MRVLFDSHAHIDSLKFEDDREFVISRARANNVGLIMNPGADLETSRNAVELSSNHDFIYAAVGVHPHEVKDMDEDVLERIEELAKGSDKVRAIGEIGLDYHYDLSPRDIQKKWFAEQIRLARKLGMPVIIHDREASHDVMTILKEEDAFSTGVLMHCYSGSVEMAKEYIRLGAYLSIAGPVTFDNNKKTPEVVRHVPLDRLLIETDSPYLTPVPFRGKRNEPMYVRHTCDRIAAILQIPAEEVEKATWDNACRFFGISI